MSRRYRHLLDGLHCVRGGRSFNRAEKRGSLSCLLLTRHRRPGARTEHAADRSTGEGVRVGEGTAAKPATDSAAWARLATLVPETSRVVTRVGPEGPWLRRCAKSKRETSASA